MNQSTEKRKSMKGLPRRATRANPNPVVEEVSSDEEESQSPRAPDLEVEKPPSRSAQRSVSGSAAPSIVDTRSKKSQATNAQSSHGSSIRKKMLEFELKEKEELAQIEAKIEDLKLRKLEREKELARLRVEIRRETLEEDIEQELSEEEDQQVHENEDGKQDSSHEEHEEKRSQRTDHWVEKAAEQSVAGSSVKSDDPKSKSEEKSSKQPKSSKTSAKKSDIFEARSSKSKEDDSISRLADVLTKALKKEKISDEGTSMYMARQTIGRQRLPDFIWDPVEWPSFLAQFISSSTQCQFTPAEDLIRLKGCLKGKARECVQALLVSPDNVEEILDTLETNFGRKDQIIWALIEKARKVPSPKEEDFHSVLTYTNAVTNMAATMKTLQANIHLQNPTLLRDLVDKLPPTLKFEWAKSSSDSDADLEEFASWLKKITKTLALTSVTLPEMKNKRRENAFLLKEESGCHCCSKDNHKLADCFKFKKLPYFKRKKIVVEHHLCFGCLEEGHGVNTCTKVEKCKKAGCTFRHHPLLHFEKKSEDNTPAKRDVAHENEESYAIKGPSGILAYLPVKVSGPDGKEFDDFVALDDGTTSTWIQDDLKSQLKLLGTPDPVKVNMMGKSLKNVQDSERVTFNIRGSWEGSRSFEVKGARTIDNIGLGQQSLDAEKLTQKHKYLDGLPISSYRNACPRILIGQANKLLSLARKYAHGGENEPIAEKTWLGWVISGKFEGGGSKEKACLIQELDEALHDLVKQSFAIDALGVKVADEKPRSLEDKRAIEVMEKTTKRIGNQFETGLLWRDDSPQMPDNYKYAYSRMMSQERKMDKEPEFATAMEAKMEEYLSKGFIKKLSHEEIPSSQKLWYLPYFGVFNPNKPGKMRLVFDAAGKCQGVSLNSKLLQGPDYLNSLSGVLWRFREGEVALSADITDMYHRIRMIWKDLPAQCFLWRGKDRKRKPDVYQITVLIFGAACSPASAQFILRLNAEEWKDEFPSAHEAINLCFYMDDYLDSLRAKDALQMAKDVIEVNRRGGFNLCKWVSNSREVINGLPEELRADNLKQVNLESNELPTGRALGVWWNAELDVLCFKLSMHKVPENVKSGSVVPTKRQVLALVMSVFDPLGIVAHVMVKAKILLQEIWKMGTHWDDKISDNLQQRWLSWLEELKTIENVSIPRCYSLGIPDAASIQLHVFNDASGKAYCTVAYLRVHFGDQVDVSFVAAKTRVAPLKEVSMPRMELQAAVVGARLADSIRENHRIKIHETHLWTDSTTVMFWIADETKRFKQFEGQRLGEIRELTEKHQWHWVPTKENVADDGTRDAETSDVSPSSRWLYGPQFLRDTVLPIPFSGAPQVSPENLEESREEAFVITEKPDSIINFQRFSSFERLVNVMGYVLKIRYKSQRINRGLPAWSVLENIHQAKICLYRVAQEQSYPEELKSLREGKTVDKKSKIVKLSPFLDKDGLIRMKGRLTNAAFLPWKTRNPVILDGNHPLSALIVVYYHRICGHQSHNTVMNMIRETIWITRLGSAVREVARNCQHCKNSKAQPQVPEMGDLPSARVTPSVRPFTYTGMDIFGPFDVVVKRSSVKRYGLLFTCLTTRAVHVEKVDSLSTDSCIMGIDRFSAIRGPPLEIFCDNGTNFRGAERELARYLEEEKTDAQMTKRGIQFHFNPPAAPHFGGAWERLVRSIKNAMNAVVKPRRMTDEVLVTVFHQAMFMVNSRPLTEISVDPENPVALTPNHFLFGPQYTAEECGLTFEDDDLHLRKHWRYAQRLSDHFWNRWMKEYLPTLMK